jgi:hypothetical protein
MPGADAFATPFLRTVSADFPLCAARGRRTQAAAAWGTALKGDATAARLSKRVSERLFEECVVGAEVAAAEQLGKLTCLGSIEGDWRVSLLPALEQAREVTPSARVTGLRRRSLAKLLRLSFGERYQLPEYIQMHHR